MSEKRKVIVDGTEFEVEIEMDGSFGTLQLKAVLSKLKSLILAMLLRRKEVKVVRKRNLELYLPIYLERLLLLKSMKGISSKRAKLFNPRSDEDAK